MFCPNCGKEIGENIRFCPYCGQKTDQGNPPASNAGLNTPNGPASGGQGSSAPAAAAPSRNHSARWILIAVIAIAAICGVGVFAWQYFHRPATLLLECSNNTGRLIYSIERNGSLVDTDWDLDEQTGQTSVVIPAGKSALCVDYVRDDQERTRLIELAIDAKPDSVVDVADLMPACIGGIEPDAWSFTSDPSYTAAAQASVSGQNFVYAVWPVYMAGEPGADILPSGVFAEYEDKNAKLFESFRYADDADGNMIVYAFHDQSGLALYSIQAIKDGKTVWGEEYGDDNRRIWRVEYNEEGNDTARYTYDKDTGEIDYYYLKSYDENGNLLQTKQRNSLESEEDVEAYIYDENGNLLQRAWTCGSFFSSSLQYDFDYDPAGRVIRSVGRDDGKDETETYYTYDDDGNLVVQEFNDLFQGSRTLTSWDSEGRILSYTDVHDLTDNTGLTWVFEYDANGDCILMKAENTGNYRSIDYLNGHPLCCTFVSVSPDDPESNETEPELYIYSTDGRLESYQGKDSFGIPVTYHIHYAKAETLQQNEDPRPNT